MSVCSSDEMKRFNYLIGEIEMVYHEIALKLGISDSAMIILYTVLDNGGACMLKDICHRSGLSKQTLNSSVRKLESEKLVCLRCVDSKHKEIILTESGREFAKKTVARVIKAENQIFDSWDQSDVEKLLSCLSVFSADIGEKSKVL